MKRHLHIFLLGASLVFVISVLTIAVTEVSSEEDVDVFCYVPEDGDYEYIDSISSFDAGKAAAQCNDVYFDCYGNCVACRLDDEGEESCFDKEGREFYK